MRAVFGLVLVLGMGLAGFAVYMVQGYMSDQERLLAAERARAAQIVETVDVYAASRSIGFGEVLTPEDVTIIKYAKDHLPEGIFETEEALFPEGTDVLRSVIRPMEPNEPVLMVKVTEPGQVAGITSQLRAGMRAFTIQVDVSSGVSGFLRPGDFVDIYWTGSVGGRGEPGTGETYLIGQSIELIAVNQSVDRNRESNDIPRTVTVQVSGNDVRALADAQDGGKLSLALVGADWAEMRTVDGEDAIILPQRAEEPVVVADAPPPMEAEQCYRVERRGTEKVNIPVACNN